MRIDIAIGTVGDMGFAGARSTKDNRYHSEDIVILLDNNPFAEDGAVAYTLVDPDIPLEDNPVYGKDGPTPREAQMAPWNDQNEVQPMSPAMLAMLKRGTV